MLPSYNNLLTQYTLAFKCGTISYQCSRKCQWANVEFSLLYVHFLNLCDRFLSLKMTHWFIEKKNVMPKEWRKKRKCEQQQRRKKTKHTTDVFKEMHAGEFVGRKPDADRQTDRSFKWLLWLYCPLRSWTFENENSWFHYWKLFLCLAFIFIEVFFP